MKQLTALLLAMFTVLSIDAQLVPKDALPEKVADGYKFTEGPTALGDHILFTDIPASRILAYNTKTGKTETLFENTERTNGLFFHRGLIYACSHGKRAVITYGAPGKEPEIIRDTLPSKDADAKPIRFNSPNDLVIDQTDGIYFTDPRYGNRDNMETQTEGVYYYRKTIKGEPRFKTGRSGAFHAIDNDLTRPNGIVLSPDEKILYVADHGANWIYAYDIESPGKVKNKRKFAQLNDGEGKGSDGMCVDKRGRLYATGHGKVWAFEPTGHLVATIDVGRQTTNCTFAGDGKTLYITANKGLYRITLNTDAPLEHAEKD